MIQEEKVKRPISPLPENDAAVQFEYTLRPESLDEYIGQTEIKRNLRVFMDAAKKRKESLEHVLLHGPAGLGKTTLAFIIAREMGVRIKVTSGPALERQGDLVSIVTNLQPEDVFFIDEIHRLRPAVEEVLYTAMEDFGIDIILGKGPSARSIRLKLPHFTLIGATTKVSLLSSPLRDRFGTVFRLNFYEKGDIEKILMRSAKILKCHIEEKAAAKLASCARQTPRVANRLLRRARDFASVHGSDTISVAIADETLENLGVDHLGLDDADRGILRTIIEKFNGGPVGLNTISAAISEEEETVEEIYEPYLLQLGLLERTNRGRLATERAFSHLNIPHPNGKHQNTLLDI